MLTDALDTLKKDPTFKDKWMRYKSMLIALKCLIAGTSEYDTLKQTMLELKYQIGAEILSKCEQMEETKNAD